MRQPLVVPAEFDKFEETDLFGDCRSKRSDENLPRPLKGNAEALADFTARRSASTMPSRPLSLSTMSRLRIVHRRRLPAAYDGNAHSRRRPRRLPQFPSMSTRRKRLPPTPFGWWPQHTGIRTSAQFH